MGESKTGSVRLVAAAAMAMVTLAVAEVAMLALAVAEVAMVKLPPPKAPTTTAAPVRLRTAKLCHHRIPTQTFGTCPTTTS